jgi:SHS2 domain-containing protein
MPYRYLEDVAIADVAFEARGETLETLFRASVDAVVGVMVDSPASVVPRVHKLFNAEDEALDLLLFQLLQEIVYFKDAEQLLLRCSLARIVRQGVFWAIRAELEGERMDPERHALLLDVKAVTLHLLSVEQVSGGWMARVVLDI